MALQVWLPLNGNLENKGLSNIDITGEGSFVNNGKLGKCYTGGAITMSQNFLTKTGTICFWIKVGSNAPTSVSPNTPFASSGTYGRKWDLFLWSDNTSTAASKNSLHSWGCVKDTSTSSANGSYTYKNIFPNDTWIHVAIAHDESKQYIYLNGSLYNSVSWDSNGTFTFDGVCYFAKTNSTEIFYNDLRIYDECLSPKQIKEISKGLVAHYKLEGIGANPNLLTYSDVPNRGKSSTSYPCATYPLPSPVVANNNYTITVNATFTDAYTIALFFGGGSYGTQWADCSTNGTYSVSWTFTANSNMAAQNFVNIYVRDADNTPSIGIAQCVVNWVKLEAGGVATDWVPNSADAMYSKLGFDNMLLKDVSGNEYNLSSYNNISIKCNSPRYQSSSYFNGTDNRLYKNNFYLPNEHSVSIWFNPSRINDTTQYLYSLSNGTGGSADQQSALYINTTGITIHAGGTSSTLNYTFNLNNWYLIVLTCDGTTQKAYVNGNLLGSASVGSKTGTFLTFGARSNNTGGAGVAASYFYQGLLSDARFYATALSAADAKQLYDTAGFVDNTNNMYAYEYKENGKLLDYADYPGAQTNLTAVFTRTVVDEPEAPTGKAVKLECTTAGSGYYFSNAPWSTAKAKMENGKTYVVSMYVKTNASRSIKMNVECASSQSQTTWTVGTEYQHLVNTFVYSNTTQYSALTDYANFVVGDVIYIHSFKIEAVEDQPKLEKTGVMDASTMDENDIAKIYKSKLEANDFIEI